MYGGVDSTLVEKQQTTTSFITYTPQKQIMSHPHPIPTQPIPNV
jgi:hypothetical protein